MRKIAPAILSILLLSAVPVHAQDMPGGGMDPGGDDGGGDGPVAAHAPAPPRPIKRERFDKMVTAMFESGDTNHDGSVTLPEFNALIDARRFAAIDARFAKADTNRDGMLSRDEFVAWQRQMGSAASDETTARSAGGAVIAETIAPPLGKDMDDLLLSRLIDPLSATVIAQANTNYDAGLSLQELLAYEGARFDAADRNHDGYLDFSGAAPVTQRRPGPHG
ncbi:calcium-binding protein [Novosphingobium colocasiae]